jgi:acyl-CoA reductase-like NAD-dependent aldehyde dehydrogenase
LWGNLDVHCANTVDVDIAVKSAEKALKFGQQCKQRVAEPCSDKLRAEISQEERRAILLWFADLMTDNLERLGNLEAVVTGLNLLDMRRVQQQSFLDVATLILMRVKCDYGLPYTLSLRRFHR